MDDCGYKSPVAKWDIELPLFYEELSTEAKTEIILDVAETKNPKKAS